MRSLLLAAGALLVAWDVIAAVVSRIADHQYSGLFLGNLAIYYAAAHVAGRSEGTLRAAATAGAAIATVDLTLGGAVFYVLYPESFDVPIGVLLASIPAVPLLGAGVGLIAGRIATRHQRISA